MPKEVKSVKMDHLAIDHFKQAAGSFATGVTVVTTCHDKQFYGLTVNSFSSVSLQPALIAFCLNRSSASFKAFTQSDYFAVNILAQDQQDIANIFAKTNINKFVQLNYQLSQENKIPLIDGSLALLECRKNQQIQAGDHDIFIGQVLKVKTEKQKLPLLYYGKSYQQLK